MRCPAGSRAPGRVELQGARVSQVLPPDEKLLVGIHLVLQRHAETPHLAVDPGAGDRPGRTQQELFAGESQQVGTRAMPKVLGDDGSMTSMMVDAGLMMVIEMNDG